MLLTPSCGTRRGSNPRQSYSCYSGERGGARGELNLQRGNWVLSRYHVITLQYSTTAGLAAISPVDILHVHKYLVTCSKPLKIWHNPRFCWRTKPSQFYLLDVYSWYGVHIVTWCWQFALQLSCVGLITATLWPVTMWQSGGATLSDHRRYCGLGPNTGDSAHYVKVAVHRYVYCKMGANTGIPQD